MGNISQEIPNTRHEPQPRHVKKAGGFGNEGIFKLLSDGESGSAIPNTTDPILDMIDKINNDSGYGKVVDADGNEVLQGEDKFLAELGQLKGLNTNFSHSNKWVGYFPLANVLGKKYSNLELNLTRFSIPQMVMGSTSTTFKGYTYEFPTHLLDADTKEIVIEYIIDEKWQNYKSFFLWCSASEGQVNQVADTRDVQTISMKDLIDCRIWLIDSFKNRIVDFVFENCWIKNFQDLSLEANNPEEVHHTITLAYSNFYLDNARNK